MKRSGVASAVLVTVLVACGTRGGVTSSSGADGAVDRGSPHTPQTGCHDGFSVCTMGAAQMCADLTSDSAHCGSCPQQCAAGTCVNGACTADTSCVGGARCSGACVSDRTSNADHCGSCNNRCSDRELCVQSACIAGAADGASCQAPLSWDVAAEERAGFRMGNAKPFAFSCSASASAARVFRFVATKDDTVVSLEKGAEKAVLEVFTSALCDATARLGCSAAAEPSVRLSGAKGKTFFAVVGAPVGFSGPLTIRVDH